jgi:hypothetical protein
MTPADLKKQIKTLIDSAKAMVEQHKHSKHPLIAAIAEHLPREIKRLEHESHRAVGATKRNGLTWEHHQSLHIARQRVYYLCDALGRELGLPPLPDVDVLAGTGRRKTAEFRFKSRDGSIDEPICFWVLTCGEMDQARAETKAYCVEIGIDPDWLTQTPQWARELVTPSIVARAARDPNDDSRPIFPSAKALREVLSKAECEDLYRRYLETPPKVFLEGSKSKKSVG